MSIFRLCSGRARRGKYGLMITVEAELYSNAWRIEEDLSMTFIRTDSFSCVGGSCFAFREECNIPDLSLLPAYTWISPDSLSLKSFLSDAACFVEDSLCAALCFTITLFGKIRRTNRKVRRTPFMPGLSSRFGYTHNLPMRL